MNLPDNYYLTTIKNRRMYPVLTGQHEVDVCVIGAGLAGINTALSLTERGKKVAIVEDRHIGYGASGRLAGFVAKGYAAGESEIAKKLGLEKARSLVDLTKTARQIIRNRAQKFNLAEGTIVDGVLTVALKNNPQALRDYIKKQNDNFDLGFEFWPREQVQSHCKTKKYFDGIYSPRDFQMNPVQYLHGLGDVISDMGGVIFENSRVTKITRAGPDWQVVSGEGSVKAKDVVLCCAVYSNGLDRRLENSVIPVQTYIMVTEPLDDATYASAINTRHAIYDTRFCSDYYRRLPDNRLLWGGRVGLFAHPENIAATMMSDMLGLYPQLEGKVTPAYAWAGLLAYPTHKMPQIGKFEEGYWYNTGYGGHGLCPTTVGGEVVAAAIANDDTAYQQFSSFGVHYSGGKLGRFGAQGIYLWWRLRDLMGI